MQHVRQCALCGHHEGYAADELGQLIGPVGRNTRNKEPLWVHRECAIWSPEAYETGDGHIRGISKVLKRGRVTWCASCQKRGATMGCRLDNCPHSFHKHCAHQAGCTFYPNQYLIACKDHAHMYCADVPAGGQTPVSPYSPYPVAGGPAFRAADQELGPASLGIKRLRDTLPEERMRNAKRAVKRLRHETRVALAAGSDDEEHFQKKDRARLARDKLRLNPVVLGSNPKHKPHFGCGDPEPASGQIPQPTQINNNVVSEGWAAVGGHAAVIQQLKEMVLLPLQYPEIFKHMDITPPRGILFHGAPGTGKTLVARALAGACSHSSTTPVTLFARKGADCLGKFAGEAERTLRLLFDEAARQAPSIIFLDELDGLVPARSSNSSGGDQVFASVVSTLLALMDGVVDRGAVVVIGATNRPEAIDPALRRPGRFDREVHFGLPSLTDRAAILKVHTSRWQEGPAHALVVVSAINKLYGRCRWQLGLSDALVVMSAIHKLCGSRRWQKGPSNALLQRIAASTEGFAGADLQALCTAAVMAAVTRAAPTLVDHLCNTPEEQEQRQPSQQQQPGKQQQQQQGDSEQPQDQFDGRCNKMQHQGQEVRQQGEQLLLKLPDKLPQKLLEKLQVAALDWRAALAAAPLPCSARQNLSALSSGHARALPHNLVPLLLPALTRALRRIATAQLPWQAPMQCALESAQEAAGAAAMEVPVQADEGPDAAAGLQRRGGMVNVLSGLGAIQAHPSYQTGSSSAAPKTQDTLPDGQHDPTQHPPTPSPRPCKLLLCGEEGAGQSLVAGALLKLVLGVQVHTLSLPMLVAGGSGDATVGLVQLLQEAMHRANSYTPLVLYLPSLEAWALETATLTNKEVEEGLAALAGRSAAGPTPQRNAQPSITPLKPYPATISPFRGLVSLQARQGGSGGSRGNPTPAPTSACKTHSTPARHLTFQQISSPDQHQPAVSGQLPDQADPTSPTMSLPSPRASRAAAAISPRPDQADPASPFQSLRSPGAIASSPRPDQAEPASPAMSLPSPRAAPTSPAQARQPQPHVLLSPTAPGRHGAAQFQSPRAAKHSGEEKDASNGDIVEVYVLSEIWKVFEQVVKQIPATQPLLILATCQRRPEQLPPVLLNFFQGQSAAATSDSINTSQLCCGATALSSTGGDRPLQHYSSSSSVVVVGSEVEPAESWQEAAHRTGKAAVHAVASAAAHSFHCQLLAKARAAMSHTDLTPLGAAFSNPRAREDTNADSPGQIPTSPRPIAEAGHGTEQAGLLGPGQTGQAAPVATADNGQQDNGHERHDGKGHSGQFGCSLDSSHMAVVNEKDLQLGLKLHAEVQRRIKLCGHQLLNDRRIRCAQAPSTSAHTNGPSPDLSIPRADPSSPRNLVSLFAVAQHAQHGCFESLDTFAESMRSAVASVCLAVEGRRARQIRESKQQVAGHIQLIKTLWSARRQMYSKANSLNSFSYLQLAVVRYSVRAAAACALGDDVTLWCHTASHQLSLSDPANQRLLTAAQRHLALHHQRQQTQSAPAQPAVLQHGLQDRAASHGLATNSNDGGQMRVDKQNDVVEAQLGIDDAGEPMVNAVDVELTELTGSDSVRSAGPAVHARTVMHAEPQQGWNGSNGEAGQQNDDHPDQQHASLTGDDADSPQHHGNELEQDQNALGHSQQALGQQQRALDSFQAQFDIGSAATSKAESMLCDALARTEAEGMLDEAPCRAESMLEVVQHLTANQREQDLPTYNAAQQQLRIRRVSLQLQHKLQNGLSGEVFAALARCMDTRSAQALQQSYNHLMVTTMEALPALSHSTITDLVVATTGDAGVIDRCLQQFQDALLTCIQALVAPPVLDI